MPLRVGMVIQAYVPHIGGAERQLDRLVPLLLARGVEPIVVTRERPGAPSREIRNGASVFRVRTHGPKALASLTYTAGAVARLTRWRPHVIHAHELLSPTTAALIAKAFLRAPVVAKVLSGGRHGDIDKLSATPHGRTRLARIVRDVDAFAVVSGEIDGELADLGVPSARRHSIPNGVDTARFAPAKGDERNALRGSHGVMESQPVVVYVGRLTVHKGVGQLLRAWRDIQDHPTAPRLWIVGEGPDGDEFRRSAPPTVSFLGAMDDVSNVLRAADIFVLPSFAEGLSNALLEAMSTGMAAIATRVGDTPELLRDVPGASVPEPGDVPALADGIRGYLDDAALRAEAGRCLRARVRDAYSLDTTADRLVALYRRLAAASRGTDAGATGHDHAVG